MICMASFFFLTVTAKIALVKQKSSGLESTCKNNSITPQIKYSFPLNLGEKLYSKSKQFKVAKQFHSIKIAWAGNLNTTCMGGPFVGPSQTTGANGVLSTAEHSTHSGPAQTTGASGINSTAEHSTHLGPTLRH